ncbi:MAG: thioesterase family protein [Pseudomonadota bacterium]
MFFTSREIRFGDVDVAGIIFYPCYFAMLNDVVDDWLQSLGFGFRRLMQDFGCSTPVVHIETSFRVPLRFGDSVKFEVTAKEIGSRSATLDIITFKEDKRVIETALTIVCVQNGAITSLAWPASVKSALKSFAEAV